MSMKWLKQTNKEYVGALSDIQLISVYKDWKNSLRTNYSKKFAKLLKEEIIRRKLKL